VSAPETSRTGLEIAILGMAGRLPGASDLDQLWSNLCGGVESISFFTDEELLATGVDPELLRHPSYVKAQGVLADVHLFDAAFFGFSPREAEILDPQQRVFLETAWQALEDAGYCPEGPGVPVGVYAGSGMSQYFLSNLYRNPGFLRNVSSFQVGIGNDKDHLATRVSYKLNLGGPAIAVQTACSTSLVAVHLACQGLLSGECDIALAGGVTIGIPQVRGYLYEEGGILSPDGHCRSFDAAAQGCVAGSGVGVVVLKRLDSALEDGDPIRAVIRGTAINNDGAAKVGYTAPSVAGQAKVIRRAQIMAEVDPETITYIEAHGTGTALGDPIEITALTRAFRAGTERKELCAVGALKSNIGHLDTAAGVAGLIKTVLALEHRQLPPSLHFETPNPRIDFANSPFYVNTELAEWTAPAPRRAGVSSFGIGGTNAHVILEEAPAAEPTVSRRAWHLYLLSARSADAVGRAAGNLAEFLDRHPDLHPADVAHTLQIGRKAFDHRQAVVARDLDDLVAALRDPPAGRVLSSQRAPAPRPVAFLFPGQGAQHPGMGAALYRTEAVFRTELDRCAEKLSPLLGLDLRQVLFTADSEEAARVLRRTSLTQAAVFAVEHALAKLWMSWGVVPQTMIGHSVGEYVAACLSGVLCLDDALTLLAVRGRLMETLPGGGMLAVPLPEPDLLPLLGPDVSLAAVNGSSLCVISGPPDRLEELGTRLRERGLDCRALHTSHAFHSAMMDPVLEPFRREVVKVALNPPSIPYLSNVTGTLITAAEATDPDYWVRHLRSTVRFADGLQTLLDEPETVLLEVGPGRVLGTLARRHPGRDAHQAVISSLPHPLDGEPEDAALLGAAARLWLEGVSLQWPQLHAPERRRRVRLPTYPFERQRYWVEPAQETPALLDLPGPRRKPDIGDWFYAPLWEQSMPPAAGGPVAAAGAWLVHTDRLGLGARLAARLRENGAEVVEVVAGGAFSRLGAGMYRIDPSRREDYAQLLTELAREGRRPTRIVHAWSVTGDVGEGQEAERRCLDLGFYSLLFLVQALGEIFLQEGAGRAPVRLDVLSDRAQRVVGDEPILPEKATLLGPCLVIPKEYPGVTCRSIDVVVPAAGVEALVAPLLAEISSGNGDPLVAWRGGRRWV
jgi:phthiocerol/phenolphthiocerol synthesis type-I polyketide synthase E